MKVQEADEKTLEQAQIIGLNIITLFNVKVIVTNLYILKAILGLKKMRVGLKFYVADSRMA